MIGALSRHVAVVFGALAFASVVSEAQTDRTFASGPINSVYAPGYRAARVGVSADSIPTGHPPVPDSFVGSDKVKHFLMSGFLEALGFGAMQFTGASRASSIGVASAATVAAGIGREVHDGRTKGLFSFGDLTWDALGLGSALLLISHTQR